jgi:hypothetical protein
MVGKFLFGGVASGSEWIAAGRLLLPFVFVSLVSGALTYVTRGFGWLPRMTSIAPISIMLGVLSYTVIFAIDPMIAGNFTPLAIWNGVLLASVFTCPIAFVMGPIFFVYIVQLKIGRKILNDSTVFYISALCLLSEFAFVLLFLNDTS